MSISCRGVEFVVVGPDTWEVVEGGLSCGNKAVAITEDGMGAYPLCETHKVKYQRFYAQLEKTSRALKALPVVR